MKMHRSVLLALPVLGALGLAAAIAADEPPARPAPSLNAAPAPVYYVIRTTHGPKWDESKPPSEQEGMQGHRAHIAAAHKEGRIVMSGPFTDGAGGMTVLKAGSVEEATAWADADPAVVSGVMGHEPVHPWMVRTAAEPAQVRTKEPAKK